MNSERKFVEDELELLATITRNNKVLTLTNEKLKQHLEVLKNVKNVVNGVEDIDGQN